MTEGNSESPIDLGSQVDQELKVTNLIIQALNAQPASPEVTNLLVQATATRDHLSLLQTHMAAAAVAVTVNPSDDDFLTLKAIGDRLDRSIQSAALVSSSLDNLNLLLGTVNKGFQIAHQLTAA